MENEFADLLTVVLITLFFFMVLMLELRRIRFERRQDELNELSEIIVDRFEDKLKCD